MFTSLVYNASIFAQFEEQRGSLLQQVQQEKQKIFDQIHAETREDCYTDDSGSKEACYFLGEYLEKSRDYDRAILHHIELYITACDDGVERGCQALEYLEELGFLPLR